MAWTAGKHALRLVFPRPIEQHYSAYQTVIRQELESPLQPDTICELKAHFERCRDAVDRRSNIPEALLDRRAEFFEGPRSRSCTAAG